MVSFDSGIDAAHEGRPTREGRARNPNCATGGGRCTAQVKLFDRQQNTDGARVEQIEGLVVFLAGESAAA